MDSATLKPRRRPEPRNWPKILHVADRKGLQPFNPEQLVFGEPTKPYMGNTRIPIAYNFEGKHIPVRIQTPPLKTVFGLRGFPGRKNNSKTVDLRFDGDAGMEFLAVMEEVDKVVLTKLGRNVRKWLPGLPVSEDKSLMNARLEGAYSAITRPRVRQKDGEVFPPMFTMRAVDKRCTFWSAEDPPTPITEDAFSQSNVMVKCLCMSKCLFIGNNSMSLGFLLEQIRLAPDEDPEPDFIMY